MTMKHEEVMKKLYETAKSNMTDNGYGLFRDMEETLPNCWHRLSSSTQKYHKKDDGSVPSIALHTYEMLNTAVKVLPMFGNDIKSTKNDALLMAIVFHDMFKYGPEGTLTHTTNDHEQTMANYFLDKKDIFLNHFKDEEFELFIKCIRYHSGRWSPEAKRIKDFSFDNLPKEVLFVHLMDMLSTKDCLK
jgi:hypothetical protein